MQLNTLFVFSRGQDVNPVFLVKAQGPLAGTVISSVRYKNRAYYVHICHSSEGQIESFIKKVSDVVSVEKQEPIHGIDVYYASNKDPRYATQV